MIKLCNYSTIFYYRKGELRYTYREQFFERLTPMQQTLLTGVEWRARRHPNKSGMVELYVDPDTFPKNKMLLAQIVFG
jgi:hypothetical protein